MSMIPGVSTTGHCWDGRPDCSCKVTYLTFEEVIALYFVRPCYQMQCGKGWLPNVKLRPLAEARPITGQDFMCSFIVIALLKFNAQTCWAWSTLDLLYKEQVRFRDIVINQMFKALKWRLSSWIQVRNAVLPPVVLKKTFYFRETKHLKRQASPRRRWSLPGRLRSSREKGRWWPRKR